ncbi:MAG: hypothetical protein Q8S12_10255 [Hydrogenophaga sp.]|uniref:hypothetical protein n=1 Tax=Hydrogenophaga sp. TaxID=1904254 RepID=UPI002733283B|nr:hypothetical protein [Hydrogenophaga sp.]MDP3626971.1 hypothetical protein [Hydrogenophaga sp.]
MKDFSRKLKQLVLRSREAETLVRFLNTRYTNNVRVSHVDLMARKTGLTERQVRDVLQQMQSIGVGSLKLGRRGARTRFEWELPVTEVSRIAVGDELLDDAGWEELEKEWFAEALDSDDEASQAELPSKIFPVPLGGGRFARLELPESYSARDVEKVRQFLALF